MQLYIPRDFFDNFHQPRLFLCNTHKTILGELHAYNVSLSATWNQYSELTFEIDKTYIDLITGEEIIDPLFNKIEPPRRILCEGVGYFSVQDPDYIYDDKEHKQISAFSVEYASASNVYMENFYVNNGEINSVEVMYEQDLYGYDANINLMYAMAKLNMWDANEQYFHRVYSDSIHYTYEQIQITDENEYLTHFGEDVQAEDILYIHAYANVQFYNQFTPELSLLHNIFKKIPEWSIGYVDYSLWNKERKLECSRETVYNLLMNTVSDLFKCHIIWDINTFTVNFYAEENSGLTDDDVVSHEWESDVYISRQNLASSIDLHYSADDIKTKLKVGGADDLSIREVNLGKNYILNLDYYHNHEWMEDDLIEAYSRYMESVEEYKPLYSDAMQNWVAAYNSWNELMNYIPAENNVLLIGDTFTKLYCLYSPIDTAYLSTTPSVGTSVDNLYMLSSHTTPITKETLNNNAVFIVQGYEFLYNSSTQKFNCNRNLYDANLITLVQKLNLYHVDDDLNGTNTDNILLTLRNKNKDVATIRVYDERVENNSNTFDANAQYYIKNEDDTYSRITFRSEDEFNTYVGTTGAAQLYINNYKVRYLIVRSSSGINEAAIDFDISEWIDEQLITGEDNLLEDLTNFTIKSIGTLGAYLCLAKNEIQDVLEADVLTHKPTEYLKSFGVNLLREKQNTYLTLFQAQIEEMYAQDKYQCIVSASQPSGKYPENTRWFDLSTTILKVWTNNVWVIDNISVSPSDIENYENYQRYIDNYYKLQAVQQVLNEKEKEATYWLSGYAVENREIDIRNYVEDTDGVLRYNGQSLEGDMQRAAQSHFKNNIITRVSMDVNFPLYKFMASEYPDKIFAVYLKNRIPYVAYADAEDVWQMEMDYYNQATELQNFFTDNQYLRLCPFIKEDEYINDNYLLTSYESEEERLDIYNELLEEANKELKKMAQPTLEFNMSMANI